MDDAKAQLTEKLKSANNILVTVSRNPSVDQLAACLGLTLVLNKQGKHAAAVFSGKVPSTLEFLKPEDTLEKNTDSLRDFIIALDKSKADKLRYKVEDSVVRIFITPYRTSISEDDLDFSQGDFNVDVVVGLGVKEQEELDEAIISHGRILHDATVTSINTTPDGGLGSINWHDPQASSLSEMVTQIAQALDEKVLDNQIATALLTGIVAETERFSNHKTSAHTMSASAALMAAGANQQLVAEKLEESSPRVNLQSSQPAKEATETNDGTLAIDHTKADEKIGQPPLDELPPVQLEADEPEKPAVPEVKPDEPPRIINQGLSAGAKMVTEPPSLGGALTANTLPEQLDPVTDPLSMPQHESPMLYRQKPVEATEQPEPQAVEPSKPRAIEPPEPVLPAAPPEPKVSEAAEPEVPSAQPEATPPVSEPTSQVDAGEAVPPTLPADDNKTLTEIEQSVDSPHVQEPSVNPEPGLAVPDSPEPDQTLEDIERSVGSTHGQPDDVTEPSMAGPDLNAVRDEISKALVDSPTPAPPQPIKALNAQPLGDSLHDETSTPLDQTFDPAQPQDTLSEAYEQPSGAPYKPTPSGLGPSSTDSTGPPPVPPPIPFQFGSQNNSSQQQ